MFIDTKTGQIDKQLREVVMSMGATRTGGRRAARSNAKPLQSRPSVCLCLCRFLMHVFDSPCPLPEAFPISCQQTLCRIHTRLKWQLINGTDPIPISITIAQFHTTCLLI